MAEYIIDVPYNIERVDANEVDSGTTLVGFSVREEVIRCRDCKHLVKHHEISPLTGDYYDYLTCGHLTGLSVRAIDGNGFCSFAERSE